MASRTTPVARLMPPQRIADSDLLAPLVISYADTARLLGRVSIRTVERLVERGELVSIGSQKLRRILYESILEYLERHRNEVP